MGVAFYLDGDSKLSFEQHIGENCSTSMNWLLFKWFCKYSSVNIIFLHLETLHSEIMGVARFCKSSRNFPMIPIKEKKCL